MVVASEGDVNTILLSDVSFMVKILSTNAMVLPVPGGLRHNVGVYTGALTNIFCEASNVME